MALTYRTKDGDTVDLICWHIYGRTSGVVEQVLTGNPGLAALGPVLQAGVIVELPEITAPAEEKVTIW
jgi:phage tail protein X